MQTWLQFQGLLQNGDQEVSAERSPNLDTHGVLACADKGSDAQVSFDPFEEQFDLPACSVHLGHLKRGQPEMIGQEDQGAFLLGIVEAHSAQRFGIALLRVEAAKPDRLIAAQAAGGIHGATLHDIELQVRFGADDEERSRAGDPGEASEVQIAAVMPHAA